MNLKKDQEMNKQFLGQIFIKIFSLILLEGIFIVAIASPINKGREYKTMPISEKSFIKIMNKALDEYTTTTNEAKKAKIRVDLRKSSSDLLKDRMAKDWVGEVVSITIDDSDASARIGVVLSREPAVGLSTTDNKAMDDKLGVHTGIDIGSNLYDAISELEIGDKVIFSGRFVSPWPNMLMVEPLEQNGIRASVGVFKFTDIKKIQSVKKSK